MPNVSKTTQKHSKHLTMSQYVVTVKNGKDIKNVDDAWAKVSPFCRLKVNHQVQTTTVRKDTRSPSWHEVMAFQVDSITGSTVELEVLDGSNADAPTSLGKCAVALDATRKDRMVPLMIKNKKGANERAGTVMLGIVFEPGTATPATAAAAPVSSAGTASPDPAAPASPTPAPLSPPVATAADEPATVAATPTAVAAVVEPPKQQSMAQSIAPATVPVATTAAPMPAAVASKPVPATAAASRVAAPAAVSQKGATAVPPPPAAAAAVSAMTDPAMSDSKLAAVLVGVVMVLMLLMQWIKNPSGSSGVAAGAEPIELFAGSRIMTRKSVASSTHYLYMTGDGNLILGPGPDAMLEAPSIWESGTAGPRCSVLFCRAIAKRDGRIVVKRGMKDVASFAVAEVDQLARHVAIKEPAAPAPESVST